LRVGLDERSVWTIDNKESGRKYILQEDNNGDLDVYKNKGKVFIQENNKIRPATPEEKIKIFQDIEQAVPTEIGTPQKSALQKKIDTPLIDTLKNAVPTKRQAEKLVDDSINKNKTIDVSEQKIRSDLNFEKLPESSKESALANALFYESYIFVRGKDAIKELGLEWDPVNYVFKDIGGGRDLTIKQDLLDSQSAIKTIVDERTTILTKYFNCKRGS
jgi:hypothetical protein